MDACKYLNFIRILKYKAARKTELVETSVWQYNNKTAKKSHGRTCSSKIEAALILLLLLLQDDVLLNGGG